MRTGVEGAAAAEVELGRAAAAAEREAAGGAEEVAGVVRVKRCTRFGEAGYEGRVERRL